MPCGKGHPTNVRAIPGVRKSGTEGNFRLDRPLSRKDNPPMARFRLDSIAQLSRQMDFAPHDVRLAQVDAAESLLHLIDPAKAYHPEFVIYRITEYRPRDAESDLLTGIALQLDLGLLIERVSDSLDLHASVIAEPELDINDVC